MYLTRLYLLKIMIHCIRNSYGTLCFRKISVKLSQRKSSQPYHLIPGQPLRVCVLVKVPYHLIPDPWTATSESSLLRGYVPIYYRIYPKLIMFVID